MVSLVKTEQYFLLDHRLTINNMYNRCINLRGTDECEVKSYEVRKVFFEIRCPFMMDSQAASCGKHMENVNEQKKRKRKRKYKDRFSSSDCNEETTKQQQKIIDLLSLVVSKLRDHPFDNSPSQNEILLNNICARTAGRLADEDTTLADLCTNTKCAKESRIVTIKPDFCCSFSTTEFVHSLVEYPGDDACIITWNNSDYLLPGKCSFFLSDMKNLSVLVDAKKKYDVIVIDPPWENKSVKRKKCYSTMSENELFDLPISHLANEGCVVFIWTTNKTKQIEFVINDLLPRWGLKTCAQWHWLKITKSGVPVVPLDTSHGKQSFENLIIGQKKSDKSSPSIKGPRVIVSVPASIHSFKPTLKDIVKDFALPDAQCLELFSRSLCQGWTSVGNEVLKLQQLNCYVERDLDVPAENQSCKDKINIEMR